MPAPAAAAGRPWLPRDYRSEKATMITHTTVQALSQARLPRPDSRERLRRHGRARLERRHRLRCPAAGRTADQPPPGCCRVPGRHHRCIADPAGACASGRGRRGIHRTDQGYRAFPGRNRSVGRLVTVKSCSHQVILSRTGSQRHLLTEQYACNIEDGAILVDIDQ